MFLDVTESIGNKMVSIPITTIMKIYDKSFDEYEYCNILLNNGEFVRVNGSVETVKELIKKSIIQYEIDKERYKNLLEEKEIGCFKRLYNYFFK